MKKKLIFIYLIIMHLCNFISTGKPTQGPDHLRKSCLHYLLVNVNSQIYKHKN